MKQIKRILFGLLASYIVVMAINLTGNYQYYTSGNDWHYSVFFSLSITTLGVIGGMTVLPAIFSRFKWGKRPTLNIILSSLIYAAYGMVLMLVSMKLMEWVLHFNPQSTSEYVNNSIYSVLFSVVIGQMIAGREFLLNLKKSIEDNERMKQEMIQSQYETLKNQVNPHFLFNSLNTLTVMIPEQPQVAIAFVEQMAKVFRYSLQHSNDNLVDVATELKVVRSYLFLNEKRYNDKLVVNIDINEQAMQRKIITQSLLMLTENAIKHNELSHEHPLSLSIYDSGDHLVVENTLQRKTILEHSNNVGLENIRKRYALATTMPMYVAEAGNSFLVKIPLL